MIHVSSTAHPDPAAARLGPRRQPPWARIEPAQLAWAALGLALVATAALVYHLTRGTTLLEDDWLWAVDRRGGGLGSLLRPYNSHLSLIPVAFYKLLFATAGASSYGPYRIVLIATHLLSVMLLYVYARRRVGDYGALLAAVLILFLGPAWQDILWPFQIAWLISIAAGVAALLMLDRRDRGADLAACGLLAVSLASSSVGLAIALGAVVDVGLGRRRWGEAWIVGVPLVLYAIWSIFYEHAPLVPNAVFFAEGFVAGSAAASISALLGVSGLTSGNGAGTVLAYGVPLGIVAVGLLIWRTVRHGSWPPRALALATMLLTFWILTAVGRAFVGPYASRYLYVDCVLVLLLAAELARGLTWSRPVTVALTIVAGAAVVSNIGILRDAGANLRSQAPITKASLAAFDITRGLVAPGYPVTGLPGYPFVIIDAEGYFATERAIGTPADTVTQLSTAPEAARVVADTELVHIHSISLQPSVGHPSGGALPSTDQVTEGTASGRGPCISFTASGVAPPGATSQLQLTLPPAGVLVTSFGGPAVLGIRRFADDFQPLGTLRAGASATLRISPDAASVPWHVQVMTDGRALVCGRAG